MDMKKYAIYARKSTESEDRQVLSIGAQIDELRQRAEQLGLKVVKVYKEARSASKLGRPVFAEMMEEVQNGNIQGILCWKLDRLARNPKDGGDVMWAIKNGLVIQTNSQTYSSEKENSLMTYLMFGMAQQYTDDLSKNVKRGNLAKIKQGGWCGLAPAGYMNKLDDHTVVPDPDRFPLIRRFWEQVMAGSTPEEARQMLNNEWGYRSAKRKRSGGTPLSKTGMYKLVRNPFYYGLIRRKHDGETVEYKGAHKPMITEEEFWRVQKILGEPVPRPQTKNFAYTGLIRCGECGAMITAYEKVKPSGKRYVYYKCTKKNNRTDCNQKQVNRSVIESQLEELLAGIEIPEAWAAWAIKWLKHMHEQETGHGEHVRLSLQKNYNEAQDKIERLTDVLVDNLISKEEYEVRKERLLAKRDQIKAKLDDQEHSADGWIDRVEQVLDFAKSAKKKFDAGDVEVRKLIARNFGSNYVLQDGKLQLDMGDVFTLLSDHSKQLHKDMDRVELNELRLGKAKTAASATVFTRWQGLQGSNLRRGFWRPE